MRKLALLACLLLLTGACGNPPSPSSPYYVEIPGAAPDDACPVRQETFVAADLSPASYYFKRWLEKHTEAVLVTVLYIPDTTYPDIVIVGYKECER